MVSAQTGTDSPYKRGQVGEQVNINPMLSARKRRLRAALITSQLEGLMILIGPKRIFHKELTGLEDEAIRQIQRLATDD